jgi:hypothetical protein
VVNATQPAILIATKKEFRKTMWAVSIEQTDLAAGIPEGDEVLAKQPHAYRRTVRTRKFLTEKSWLPKEALQFSHRFARRDARQDLVAFGV